MKIINSATQNQINIVRNFADEVACLFATLDPILITTTANNIKLLWIIPKNVASE
ncbi:hypothetical protein [Sphingobacterium corticis]|uniref:hypothetical protein n=1 Tax=Sphingobacterium corticis TaxID=1812823 RepID=UPI0036D2CA87